jgi:hypothetical protein
MRRRKTAPLGRLKNKRLRKATKPPVRELQVVGGGIYTLSLYLSLLLNNSSIGTWKAIQAQSQDSGGRVPSTLSCLCNSVGSSGRPQLALFITPTVQQNFESLNIGWVLTELGRTVHTGSRLIAC